MNVLFIGGTGLISTAIARKLLEAGHGVTLFNRGKTESRLPEGAQVIHGDRHDVDALQAAAQSQTWDAVLDMVAFAPADTEQAIAAFSGHCGQFIFCSTVCVYSGPVQSIPTPETEAYHSIGSYGKNKAICEQLLFDAHAQSGFPATIMRPSHSYGEGGQIIRAWGSYAYMGQFVDRLRKGKPIIIPGNGNSLWASCHVDDVANGFIGTLENEKCVGQAYNITGEEWMTWNEYHRQVASVVGGTLDAVHVPTETLLDLAPDWTGSTNEIFQWPSVFDNARLKRDTGYRGQTVDFRTGVARTLAWMEANGKLVDSDTDTYEDELVAAWRKMAGSLPRH